MFVALPVIPFWSRSGGRRYYSFQIIAKWFKEELATAMGYVALARIGSQARRHAVAIPLARAFSISTPVLLGLGSVGRYDCFLHFCGDGQEAGQTDGSSCHCCRYGR